MQAQAVACLHLMRALTLTTHAEVFAFATSLTRLTTVLAHHSAQEAFDEATERVTDRFGGTRIAHCLSTLLASHHGGTLRGAVVLIASDGWDGDPPDRLATAMARLRRRAHTVIWLNPRAAAPGFAPRTTTMAAALPYVDLLLPADSFGALLRVPGEIAGLGRPRARAREAPSQGRGELRDQPPPARRMTTTAPAEPSTPQRHVNSRPKPPRSNPRTTQHRLRGPRRSDKPPQLRGSGRRFTVRQSEQVPGAARGS
jgi:hypothetical protein